MCHVIIEKKKKTLTVNRVPARAAVHGTQVYVDCIDEIVRGGYA